MLCAICHKKTERACWTCREVSYCSRHCQKVGIGIHKEWCSSFIKKEWEGEEQDGLKSSSAPRISVFAKRDLELGDCILEEFPLFYFPRVPHLEQAKEDKGKEDYLLCVTCGTNLSGFSSTRCSKCEWPVCADVGRNCAKHKIHAKNECGILASRKITYDSLAAHEDRRVLLILRVGAVKVKQPDLWDELMKRADELEASGKDSIVNREEISKLEDTMKKLEVPKEDEEAYTKFFSLLNLTSIIHDDTTHVVYDSGEKRTQARVGNYLYPLFNYFPYSCVPNCNFTVEDFPTFKIHVRAARPIKKGEELFVQQRLVPWYEGTIERRLSIKNQFGYLCKCKRCSDPQEFGTLFSGIVCTDCRPQGQGQGQGQDKGPVEEDVGYFLPLVSSPESEEEEKQQLQIYSPFVQCNGCKTTRPYSFFEDQLSMIRGELDENFGNYFSLMDHSKTDLYMELEAEKVQKYASKYQDKIIHSNHFLMYKAVANLCTIYGQVLTFKDLGLDGMVQRKIMYEKCFHYTNTRLRWETRLLDGAIMDRQAHDQSIIANSLLNLARIQALSYRDVRDMKELLEILPKLQQSIEAFRLTIDFYTKHMPTCFKPKFCLEAEKNGQQKAEEMFQQFRSTVIAFMRGVY